MGDWNLPVLSSNYADVLDLLDDKDFDAGSLFLSAPTNPRTGMIRYNRATNIFEEYNGAAWVAKSLAIAGGGTGAVNAADARTNLGIGTLGTQNAGAVAITGGTISGITAFTLHGSLAFNADDTHDIGTNAIRPRKAYFRSALVAPVGVDKYATS